MAAAAGTAGGMAMGYGLGRIHRPDFHLNSPQEEYYYKHYVSRKHGARTAQADGNRASGGYSGSQDNESYTSSLSEPPMTYTSFMEKCVSNLERDQAKIIEQSTEPAGAKATSAVSASAGSNKTTSNESSNDLSKSEVKSVAPPLSATPDDGDKTVSIVEIGYPALIYQHNVKTCMERFMAYSEFFKAGASGMGAGSQGLVALAASLAVMLLNSSWLMSLCD